MLSLLEPIHRSGAWSEGVELQLGGQLELERAGTGPGAGANRGSARGSRRRMMGTAGTAFAGNVGSVNTEEQNDDVLLPYMKGNT